MATFIVSFVGYGFALIHTLISFTVVLSIPSLEKKNEGKLLDVHRRKIRWAVYRHAAYAIAWALGTYHFIRWALPA